MANDKSDKTNWEDAQTWHRVVASILATDVKVDLKKAAKYYGTTYDTLENRFRKIKKLAAELKHEVDSGQRPVSSAPTTPRRPKTPKKDVLANVANGRVTKPSPKETMTAIKQESAVYTDHSSPIHQDVDSVINEGGLFDPFDADLFGTGGGGTEF